MDEPLERLGLSDAVTGRLRDGGLVTVGDVVKRLRAGTLTKIGRIGVTAVFKVEAAIDVFTNRVKKDWEDDAMGLSYAECLRLSPQLAALHPQAPGNRKAGGRPRVEVNDRGQNKTESAFDLHLAGMKRVDWIGNYWWEPVKLRLAGNTSLRIDFLVQRLDDSIALVDVKGRMEEDAAVKIKVAAEVHTWADVYLAYKIKGGWDVRAVDRGGVARVARSDWWMRDRRPRTPED